MLFSVKPQHEPAVGKDTCTKVFIAALVTIAKTWNQIVSVNRWMDKEDVVCTHIVEYYSAVKKNKILPFAETQLVLEGFMRSETGQRKINTMWYHLHVESKKIYNELVNMT